MKRVERIKEMLSAELPTLESWPQRFHANLEQLFSVTPFYTATELGYFEQEFRGEWSASSTSVNVDTDKLIEEHELYTDSEDDNDEGSWFERFIAGITTEAREIYEGAKNFARNTMMFGQDGSSRMVDPKLIHQNFDAIYGWAQLHYKVQLYDVDYDRLVKIRAGESHYVEESHFSDDERFVETGDGSIKELVFVQDLLTETVEFNENTLLAELSVQVRLFENDYVDYSSFIEFKSLFGGMNEPDLQLDVKDGRIQFQQEIEVIDASYMNAMSSRKCPMSAALTLTQSDASKNSEELKEASLKLPGMIRPWAKQFSDDYNEENAYFLDGIGTD